MPLEIRELVIKTSVSSDRPQGDQAREMNAELSEAAESAIISACVDQVLAILQTRSER